METQKIRSQTITIDSLCVGLFAGAVTAAALGEFVFAVIAAVSAIIIFVISFIYWKKHPLPALTEEEKADADFMKKYNYAKSTVLTLRIILHVLFAAFGVIAAALIFAHYMIILYVAPFVITCFTMLLVNRVMFAKVDVTEKPKLPPEENKNNTYIKDDNYSIDNEKTENKVNNGNNDDK